MGGTGMEDLAQFHDELRTVAGDLLAKDREPGWQTLVDAGWVGIEVSDDLGGAGASFTETAVLLDQIGRAAATTGYLGGAVLTVGALLVARPCDDRDRLLAAVAAGDSRTAVVLDGFTLDGSKCSGRAEFIADADGADQLLVVTGSGLAVVSGSQLTVEAQPVLDATRRLGTVTADAATVETLLAFSADREVAVAALHDRAAVAIACDSLGIAEQMLTATVDYVAMRHQFGRPIGSFQAVKHACADMLVSIEVSRQLVAQAVTAIDARAAGRDTRAAAAMAKAYSTSAAVSVAGKAMQLHGGIGYTWESGIHRYLKRATLNRSLFGSPAAHRNRLAQRYFKSAR